MANNQIQKTSTDLMPTSNDTIVHSLAINGDISKLNEKEQVVYYKYICDRIGLDPLTQPLKKITMQGKTTLYCDRSGIAQLTHLYEINHEVIKRETINDIYIVICRVTMKSGRSTEGLGAVSLKGLSGDALANAYMKAETKAKRRGVLDLVGLGILDESEIESIKSDNYANASNADELNKRWLQKPKSETQDITNDVMPSAPVQVQEVSQEEPKTESGLLKQLNTIGSQIYGKQWDEKRHELVSKLTNGRTESSTQLTDAESQTLINGLSLELKAKNNMEEISSALASQKDEEGVNALYKRLDKDLQKHPKIKALFQKRNKELSEV